MQLSSLTIFFPALNDAKILPYLLAKAQAIGHKVAKDLELIVIDDGSTDETPQLLISLQSHYPELKVIRHARNQGYGAALRSGFTAATKDWVFYTDGDGQYDPEQLSRLVTALKPGIDVVNGYKLNRSDSFWRRAIGMTYNRLSHIEYKLPIRDVQCDFRLIKRSFVKNVTLTSNSGLICLELIVKLTQAGAKFTEVGVDHFPRQFGRSQFFRLPNLYRTLVEHINLVTNRR